MDLKLTPPWLHCICVVKFDLEFGQAMELVEPECALTEKEKMAICYLSLPDSNSGCLGDTKFHFRLKTEPKSDDNWAKSVQNYNEKIPAALQAQSAFYFGFVYFRQVKDKTVPRGYMQKSVVVITHLPLIHLFNQVSELIASDYFDNEKTTVDHAFRLISDLWPYPEPGKVLNLPLSGVVMQVRLPSRFDTPISPNKELVSAKPSSGPVITLSTAYETNAYEYLLPVLSHVQALWELVLCEEPIVVMAQSPTVCASVVQSLAGFVYPLTCSDYRPFFTIHDAEFKDFTKKSADPPKLIMGVTNFFFAKSLQHWPHIVRLCDSGDMTFWWKQ